MGVAMPFRSLVDPVDIARAHAALNRAWSGLKESGDLLASEEAERTRLAVIIASLVSIVVDENELTERAIAQFRRGERD